jgi:acetyl esterase/lipase
MLHLVIGLLALAIAAAAAHASSAPSAPTPFQVNVTPDLDYVPSVDYAHGRDRLDIYSPAGATRAPVVLMFHGGGLTGGDRKDERRFGYALAQLGYVVVAASYRLSPAVLHPAHVEDAAGAFAWVKRYAAGWGGDARRVFVAGYSAGGYLAALVGCDRRYLEAHDLSTNDIAGLILIAATFDLTNRPVGLRSPWGENPTALVDASPVSHIGAHVPRTLMIVGEGDESWRLKDHREAAAKLKAAGARDITLHVIPARDHTTIRRRESEEQAPDTIAAIRAFLH